MNSFLKHGRKLYIADIHFGHRNIIQHDGRPFDSLEEMTEELICRWNRKVGRNDDVYVLGDFSTRIPVENVRQIVSRLHGRIHLVRGNHDKSEEALDGIFASVQDYLEVEDVALGMSCYVILSHYWMPFCHYSQRWTFMLHGHTHQTADSVLEERLKEEMRKSGIRCEAYNVGCMWQDYTPQTLDEIIARQERKICPAFN